MRRLEEKESGNFSTCLQHESFLNLYCKNEECEQQICHLCISQSHSGHKIVDLEEEEKGKFDSLTADFKRCEEELFLAKRDSDDMSEKAIKRIEKRKYEFMSRFDCLIAEVKNFRGSNNKTIGDYVECRS